MIFMPSFYINWQDFVIKKLKEDCVTLLNHCIALFSNMWDNLFILQFWTCVLVIYQSDYWVSDDILQVSTALGRFCNL